MLQLYLFNAQEFASKSLLTEENDTLAGILALTAFDLVHYGYRHYAGSPDDILYDIRLYEAVQKACMQLDNEVLYKGRHWTMKLENDLLLIGDAKNQLLLSGYGEPGPEMFPLIEGRSRKDLSQKIDVNKGKTTTDQKSDPFIRIISVDHSRQRIIFGNSAGEVNMSDIERSGPGTFTGTRVQFCR